MRDVPIGLMVAAVLMLLILAILFAPELHSIFNQ